MDRAAFDGYSLWLFTFSDLKTIVGPSLVFGTANGRAITRFHLETNIARTNGQIAARTPIVALWIWLQLLPFTINNQTAAGAVEEDKINKPWRTLPAGRMTIPQAKRLMLSMYCLAGVTTVLAGGVKQSISLAILGKWYNNLAGGDQNCLIRNVINACGYVCFTSGAMEVALGVPLPLERHLLRWFASVAAIIFSTVHLQDMYDQTGDRIRGRKTVPLVVGDGRARWTIAAAMLFWGYTCPRYWDAGIVATLSSILLASSVAARTLLLRTVVADRFTFKIWNIWMTLVFILPLVWGAYGGD